MNALILTEGGNNIGWGHITRCTSLYQSLKLRRVNVKMAVNGDKHMANMLPEGSIVANWLDTDKLRRLLKGIDIAVVDSYLAGKSHYRVVAEAVKVPLYIDDNIRLDYPRGTVLNGSIYAEKYSYPKSKQKSYLLGARYIPIRKEFWNTGKLRVRKEAKSVLILFGGNDLSNLTSKIYLAVKSSNPNINITIVLGKNAKELEGLHKVVDVNTRILQNLSAKQMLKVMKEADYAISAGGQTLYELARVGLPAIVIKVAENQKNNIKGWQKAGFVINAGNKESGVLSASLGAAMIKISPCETRKRMGLSGYKMVDGKGAVRAADYIVKTMNSLQARGPRDVKY